ncbi:hypothetical protein GY45DRAFT_719161 [Cubamyces sp. BRFM 1775]|nr:hypothetical protein GY45DRAFT_719161 [Cubamyces sp. BRFM 1775]
MKSPVRRKDCPIEHPRYGWKTLSLSLSMRIGLGAARLSYRRQINHGRILCVILYFYAQARARGRVVIERFPRTQQSLQ